MDITSPLFFTLIFIIAALYSSVGHGGASGYLALMAFLAIAPAQSKPIALLLNILVSAIAFIQFYRKNHFDKRLFFILALASVPAAFLGARININPTLYKQMLGAVLLITSVRLFIPQTSQQTPLKQAQPVVLLSIGIIIGLLSGLLGIGGGILLSPILILLAYSDTKTTAGISAAFIFVNSIAGLLGKTSWMHLLNATMYQMLTCAFLGGLLGAYLGAMKFDKGMLRRVLAAVLAFAAIKLIMV